MAEKPILFSTAMVLAILNDDKAMTRRILKPQPNFPDFFGICIDSVDNRDIGKAGFGDEEHLKVGALVRLPYNVGDKLWVRETWCKNENPKSDNFEKFEYRADYEGAECQDLITWKPSIFMPKEAARIWLEVTDARVERLQDITAEDIRREGMTSAAAHVGDMEIASQEWALFWDSFNAKRGYGWNTNPWVEVVTFKRTEVSP